MQNLFNLLLLFVFSFLSRLSVISLGPYHLDSLNLAVLSEKAFNTHQLHCQLGSASPLTILLGAIFIALLRVFSIPDPIFAVNFMSVAFSSLSVPVLYLLVDRLFDRSVAIFSALLFSVLPSFLGISVYGTSHTPSLFFLSTGYGLDDDPCQFHFFFVNQFRTYWQIGVNHAYEGLFYYPCWVEVARIMLMNFFSVGMLGIQEKTRRS